jgi:formate hydrogenlyase transcriptional activator
LLAAAPDISGPAGIRTLGDAERAHIVATLHATRWVIGGAHGAAAHLGLPRTTLLARMQRLGISGQPAQGWTRKQLGGIVSLRESVSETNGEDGGALQMMEAVAG